MTPAAAPISQDGQVSLSRKSHYLENAGAEPAPATKGCSRPQNTRTAREDGLFVLFVNYHRLVLNTKEVELNITGVIARYVALSFESAI